MSTVDGPHVRVSDRERDSVAQVLRDQCAQGRLSVDEFDERVEAVYPATTRNDLAELTSDLPADDGLQRPRERATRRIFWPGISAFHEERALRASCKTTFDTALREIVPRMGMQGFHLDDEVWPRRLRFVRRGGLIVTVLFHPAGDGGTIVTAFGHAPRAVRKAFATLRD